MSSEKNPEYRVGQEIWRAGGAVVRFRPSCAHNHMTKSGIEYCGAQIIADEGTDWRAKVMLAPSLVAERVFAKALAPRAIVGDGVVLRVEAPIGPWSKCSTPSRRTWAAISLPASNAANFIPVRSPMTSTERQTATGESAREARS